MNVEMLTRPRHRQWVGAGVPGNWAWMKCCLCQCQLILKLLNQALPRLILRIIRPQFCDARCSRRKRTEQTVTDRDLIERLRDPPIDHDRLLEIENGACPQKVRIDR